MADGLYNPPLSGVTQYINGGGILTVAQLIATYPPSATVQGMYARVSDLYGSLDDIMRCRFDGTNYRWVPQRESFNGNIPGSGSITLIPLVSPPTVSTPTTLTGNISINPSATNAYYGQRWRIIVPGTLGVYTATVTGLVGSNLSLLGNASHDIEYGASGWFNAT